MNNDQKDNLLERQKQASFLPLDMRLSLPAWVGCGGGK
jgi:hypothetical protein